MRAHTAHFDLVLSSRPRRRAGLAGVTSYAIPRPLAGLLAGLGMAVIQAKPEITYRNDRAYKGGKKAADGIEIRFGGKVNDEVIERLKTAGFRFSSKQKMWYNLDSVDARKFAEELATEELDVDDAPTKTVNFWVTAKSVDELWKQSKSTWYKVEGAIVKGKAALAKYSRPRLESSVNMQKVQIMIFREVPVDADGNVQAPAATPANLVDPQVQSGSSGGAAVGKKAAAAATGFSPALEEKLHNDIAERLQAQGDALTAKIDAKFNSGTSKQRYTARRARIAAGMASDGVHLKDQQDILYTLAAAHRDRTKWPLLDKMGLIGNIRKRTEAELLVNAFGHKDDALVRYVSYRAETYAPLFLSKEATVNAAQMQAALANMVAGDNMATTTAKLIEQAKNLLYAWRMNSPAQNSAAQQAMEEAEKRQRENELHKYKIPGFFPTPQVIIDRMVELADIQPGHRVLEPSAGKGDIADAIRARHPDAELALAEISSTLRNVLRDKGYDWIFGDFLEDVKVGQREFDRILMNPPFENGQDIQHVMHAYSLLAPGGKLVAILGEGAFINSYKRNQEFYAFLGGYSGETIRLNSSISHTEPDDYARQHNVPSYMHYEKLPAGSFKDAFNSTGVATRLLVLHKPAAVAASAPAATSSSADLAKAKAKARARAQIQIMTMRLRLEQDSLSGVRATPSRDKLKLRIKALDLKEHLRAL